MQREPLDAEANGGRVREAIEHGVERVHEGQRRRRAEVDRPQSGQFEEDLAQHVCVNVIVQVLLQQDLLDGRRQVEALLQSLRR